MSRTCARQFGFRYSRSWQVLPDNPTARATLLVAGKPAPEVEAPAAEDVEVFGVHRHSFVSFSSDSMGEPSGLRRSLWWISAIAAATVSGFAGSRSRFSWLIAFAISGRGSPRIVSILTTS